MKRTAINAPDDSDFDIAALVVLRNNRIIEEMLAADNPEEAQVEENENHIIDHRTFRRGARKIYDTERAFVAIRRDYLSADPLYASSFVAMFRISRARFEHLMTSVMGLNIAFYQHVHNRHGRKSSSIEARLLLPLKTLAHGVGTHVFMDYFQMSPQLASECCRQFDNALWMCYAGDFLRLPTANDLFRIEKLHKAVHGVNGMFGSIDCTHTYWKNCPKAWQGSFSGKEHKPSIVLEAICDHHTYFWHVSYGAPGRWNDINIFNSSPFYENLMNGRFHGLELESGIMLYRISNEMFDQLFILTDGIYPAYSRFIKGLKEPVTLEERRFTGWQESARKDIERSFGILKSQWKFCLHDIYIHDMDVISKRMNSCLILHNVLVTDRIMESIERRYDPTFSMEVEGDFVEILENAVHDMHDPVRRENRIVDNLTALQRWREFDNRNEHGRLFLALMNEIHNK